jgi:hypothetical protein
MPARPLSRPLALALIGALAVVLILRFVAHQTPTDFAVYLRAWQRFSQHQSPYVLSDPSPYKYAPGILLLFGLLPHQPAQAWMVFSTLSILAFSVSLAFSSGFETPKKTLLLAVGYALAWKGILETLDYGQIELLIFSVAIGAGVLLIRKPRISGALAGTLPWFKLPWGGLAVPFILILLRNDVDGLAHRKLKRWLTGFIGSMIFWGAAVPSWLCGAEEAKHFSHDWLVLLKAQPADLFSSPINQSLLSSMTRWLGGSGLLGLGLCAVLGGYLLGRLLVKTKGQETTETLSWLSPWLLWVQLMNPLSWRWGSLFAVGMPLAARPGRASWVLAPVILVLGCLQLNPVVQVLGFQHWTDLHPLGVVTLYWLALMFSAL